MLLVRHQPGRVRSFSGRDRRVSVRKPAFGVSFVEIQQKSRREPGTAPKQRRNPAQRTGSEPPDSAR